MDLKFIGSQFTWWNNYLSRVRVYEQIDQTFAIADWI